MTQISNKIRIMLYFALGGIILPVIILLPLALHDISRFQSTNEEMYNQLFKTRSLSIELKYSLSRIHDKMQETGLTSDRFKRGIIISEINSLDKISREKLAEIKTDFKGNPSDINELQVLLDQWMENRLKIIGRFQQGLPVLRSFLEASSSTFQKIELVNENIINVSARNAAAFMNETNSKVFGKYSVAAVIILVLVLLAIVLIINYYRNVLFKSGKENLYLKEISESENKFRNLFESSIDCLVITDTGGNIIDINKNGYSCLGYTKDEIIGKHISTVVSPALRNSVPERVSRINGEGFFQFESEHVCKDGRVFPVEVLAHRITYNGQPRLFSINRNISDRKNMEKTLEENIAKYRAVVETTPEGFLIINLRGEILEVNDSYLKQSGFSREDLLMMRFWDLSTRENIEKSMGRIHKIFRNGFDQYEGYHETKDGKIWPVEVSASFWETSNNLVFIFVRDITERKNHLIQLRENEEKFRVLFENANDEMMILNCEGIIVDVNYSGYNQRGYTREDMIGRPISHFVSNKEIAAIPDILEKLLKYGNLTYEMTNICKDGTEVQVDVNAQVIEQAGEKFIFSIARDITERMKKLESIQTREAISRAVIDRLLDS